jgi:hypothetical protein
MRTVCQDPRVASRPPLSVVVGVREGLHELGPVLEALRPQALRTGSEVLVVGRVRGTAPEPVRLVRVDDDDLLRLRMIGIREARGEIVAIGEDHAVPRADWCEAVLRAHAERPEVPAIAGCLVNATARTLSGRGNFLAFAAPFQPPMPVLPPLRPPPVSTLSLKREALGEIDRTPGRFEAMLVPRLFAEGGMVADDRIVVDHHQDHGIPWSIVNGFHGARASYGYLRAELSPRERLRQARWSIVNWPRRILGEARAATRGQRGHRADLVVVALVGTAVGVGAAAGSLAGPGRSPARVA